MIEKSREQGRQGGQSGLDFSTCFFLLLHGLAFSICFLVTPSFISETTLDQKVMIQKQVNTPLVVFYNTVMIFLLLSLQNLIQPHSLILQIRGNAVP